MGRPLLLQLLSELGNLLQVCSPSIPGAPQAFISQLHHFNGEVRLSTDVLELGGELLLFHSELEQNVPVLGKDCLCPKIGEECLHR